MGIYEKKSLIECKVEDLFNFHLDTNNLKVISPKGVKVTLLNEGFIPKEGAVLRLKTVKNFIPMIWEVKIDRLDAPNLLVDIAMKSPFKKWKHSHIFTQIDENLCELKDVVEYTLPFGFLGSFFDFFIQYELKSMFEFRHKVTKKLLEDTL
nr:SRPBCC family protein [uncultured Sulfurimonas sp.]